VQNDHPAETGVLLQCNHGGGEIPVARCGPAVRRLHGKHAGPKKGYV